MIRTAHVGLIAVLGLAVINGCAEKGPSKKPLTKVKGIVHVDGVPAAQVNVTCNDVMGIDKTEPTVTTAITNADGSFALSTYETGDGIPAGEYTLTFFWGELNVMTMTVGGPDKLNNRYADVKNGIPLKVESSEPVDLGVINLKTKD